MNEPMLAGDVRCQNRARFTAWLLWLWMWTTHRSCLVIALLLQAAYWSIQALLLDYPWDYSATILSYSGYGIVLALPGPIQRRNWRQMVGALIIGGLAPYVAHWATSFADTSQNLMLFMAWPAAMMLFVATGEWLFRKSDEWQTLVWMGVCCLAAAALYTLVNFFICHSLLPPTWISLTISPLLAAFTWVAIPVGVRLAHQHRRTHAIGVIAILAIMAFYAIVFEWGVFELAKPSIRGHGPFSRTFGVVFLDNRGLDSDYQFILNELRHADWSQPYGFRGMANFLSHTADNWRPTAVKVLVRHDPAWAAEHLSRLLVDRPSRQLIDMSESLFVDQHRYETVPILIRYALVEEGTYPACMGAGKDRFTNALENLQVPQVASVLLVRALWEIEYRELANARRTLQPFKESNVEAYNVEPKLQHRLTKLLGNNAGARVVDWLEQYDTMIVKASTPLSDSQKHDTDRVVKCFWEYFPVQGEWVQTRMAAAYTTANQELGQRGMTKQLQSMQELFKKSATGKRVEIPEQDSELGKTLILWEDLRMKAYDSFSLPQPDWDAPTTDSLEKEVHAFVNRVTDAIKNMRPRAALR